MCLKVIRQSCKNSKELFASLLPGLVAMLRLKQGVRKILLRVNYPVSRESGPSRRVRLILDMLNKSTRSYLLFSKNKLNDWKYSKFFIQD